MVQASNGTHACAVSEAATTLVCVCVCRQHRQVLPVRLKLSQGPHGGGGRGHRCACSPTSMRTCMLVDVIVPLPPCPDRKGISYNSRSNSYSRLIASPDDDPTTTLTRLLATHLPAPHLPAGAELHCCTTPEYSCCQPHTVHN